MNTPKIAMVVPVYKNPSALHSFLTVLKESNPHSFELIVVNGGDDLETIEIISQFKDLISKSLTEPDRGVYDAMNKGTQLADADWVLFMGVDDTFIGNVNSIEKMLDKKYAFVYGNVFMPGRGAIYDGKFSKYKLIKRNICHQAIIYNKKVILENMYDLKYSILADYKLNIEVYSKFKCKYFNHLFSVYNDIGGLSSSNVDKSFVDDKCSIIRNNFGVMYYLIYMVRGYLVSMIKNISGS